MTEIAHHELSDLSLNATTKYFVHECLRHQQQLRLVNFSLCLLITNNIRHVLHQHLMQWVVRDAGGHIVIAEDL